MNEAQIIQYLRQHGVAKIGHKGPSLQAAMNLADKGLVVVLTDNEADGYSTIRLTADRRKQAQIRQMEAQAVVPLKVKVVKGVGKVAKVAGRAVQSYATAFNDEQRDRMSTGGQDLGSFSGGFGGDGAIDASAYPGLSYYGGEGQPQIRRTGRRVVTIGGSSFVEVAKKKAKKSRTPDYIMIGGKKYKRA